MPDETTEPTTDDAPEAADEATSEEPTDAAAPDATDGGADVADEDGDVADEDGDEAEAEELTEEERAELEERAARKAKADAVIAERRAQAARAAGKDPEADAKAKAKGGKDAKGDAKAAEAPRRTVTSRRVTPKGGAAAKADPKAPAPTSKARDAKKTESVRKTAAAVPVADLPKGPSPWWVPTLMWVLLVAGAVVIMANYALSGASNIRLVIGLGLILGGIITATQYR